MGIFRYSIVNLSVKIMPPIANEVDEWKAKSAQPVTASFDVPEEGLMKVFIYGEILSANNFEYDNLYVHYLVELPKHWIATGSPAAKGSRYLEAPTIEKVGESMC